MTRKRKLRVMKSLHVSELYEMVKSGDEDATEYLIDMQQRGRHLRYYPKGRSSIYDYGVVPISMDASKGCVEIRSGRPMSDFALDMDTCFSWIIGIPKCISQCLFDLQEEGYELVNAHLEMDLRSDHDHEFELEENEGDYEDMIVSMFPRGASRWRLGYYDAAVLLQEMCNFCYQKEWEYEEQIDDSDLEDIAAVLKKLDEY